MKSIFSNKESFDRNFTNTISNKHGFVKTFTNTISNKRGFGKKLKKVQIPNTISLP